MKKYQNKKHSLKNKLLSYSALGAAFLLVDNEAQAQCGVVDAANPTLAVDIDGDGNADVNLSFNTFSGPYSITSTVPGAATASFLNTQGGTLSGSTYIGPNFSYYGCQPVAIPGQYGNGFYGGSFFQGDPGLGSYTTIVATASINLQINVLNTFQYYYTFFSGTGNFVVASAAGSNNIVGVTAGASNLAVCGLIDSAPGVNGPDATIIGSVYNVDYLFFSIQAAQSVQYVFGAASVNPFPTSTCFTSSYSYYGIYLPPAAPLATFSGSTFTTVGPFGIGSSSYATGTLVGSNVSSDWLAVQFTSGTETHNGWIELSYDGTTGAVSCLSTGFNSCSLESALMTTDINNACIVVGNDDPNDGEGCPVMIPTLSQWGLITLMLLLMSYGSLALTSFGRMLQMKEESQPNVE